MSEFSNLLNTYIHQKGYSIRSLAKRAGIPVATLTKICSGSRSPRNQRERINRISDVLMLTPSQQDLLNSMLEKEIVGAENYISRTSMKALIEGMSCTVRTLQPQPMRTVLPPLSTAEKRTDVYALIRTFLENATQGPTLDIYLQPRDPVVLEALCRVVDGGTTKVRHILTLTASDGKHGVMDSHNLDDIRRIQPLLLNICNNKDVYQPYYYYEHTAASSSSVLQFPVVMISEQGVLRCTADYSHAIYSADSIVLKYFQRLFRIQLSGCRPLAKFSTGMHEQIIRYSTAMQSGDPEERLLILEWQPCLMQTVQEQEVIQFLPENIPFRNEYISLYLPYLRKIKQWKKSTMFFAREGLEAFARNGRLQEIPEELLSGPLPVSMRIELLRRLLDQTQKGNISPYIVRDEKFRIGPDTQLISYGSDTILLASLNHAAGNRTCFIEELSTNWSALDFLENLEATDWFFSVEETCQVIRNIMKECFQEEMVQSNALSVQ